jgi:hypothetical protein
MGGTEVGGKPMRGEAKNSCYPSVPLRYASDDGRFQQWMIDFRIADSGGGQTGAR